MLLERRLADQQGSVLVATFDAPASAVPESADLVEAGLTIDDGDGRAESYTHLGLSSQHPRYIATELCAQSALVWPDVAWAGSTVTPADASLAAPPPSDYFAGGADR